MWGAPTLTNVYIIVPIYRGETGANMYPVPPPSVWESLERRGGLAHLSCVLCRLGSSRGVSWSCRRVVCRDWVGSRIKEWGWQPVLEGAKDGGLELGWK